MAAARAESREWATHRFLLRVGLLPHVEDLHSHFFEWVGDALPGEHDALAAGLRKSLGFHKLLDVLVDDKLVAG